MVTTGSPNKELNLDEGVPSQEAGSGTTSWRGVSRGPHSASGKGMP